MAATLALPMLVFIEADGYAIPAPSTLPVPDGDMAATLAYYQCIALLDGDGTAPIEAAQRIAHALTHVRAGLGPALLRLRVPRLNGHSSADAQGYKDEATKAEEWRRDPLGRVRALLIERGWSEAQ